MKRFFGAIRRFFLPPADAKVFTRVVPLFAVAFVVILFFAFANVAWESTNSPSFCGLTCHTMPPEYTSYKLTAHTNVSCEDCHMGRDTLGVMIKRKVTYSWQTGTAMLFGTYTYPIFAKNMAPAREACENCHKPEKFSTDTLVEFKRYAQDVDNTLTSTYLVVKTGGGTQREGLGQGIHWHIENPVYYYAADAQSQNIPYVMVQNADGSKTEYTDVQAEFDPASVNPAQLKKMDCITCHNRTAHIIDSPNQAMDSLLSRQQVSVKIPSIKQKGVEVMSASYASEKEALDAIAKLDQYYQTEQADFYAANKDLVTQAVQSIQTTWKQTNFIDQKDNWQTHPNNLGHEDSPGCMRCHDGKHVTKDGSAVRLECNLCHSVPVVSGANKLTANIEVNKTFEPDTHKNPNWISLHNQVFNETCKGCHTTEDAGGTSNKSFCSNGACHGATWKFAGFDAPKMRAILAAQAEAMKPTPAPADAAAGAATASSGTSGGPLTYASVLPIFQNTCGACHGDAAMKGLNVTTYETLMKGSEDGAVITPGDAQNSKLVQVQSDGGHPGQLSSDDLKIIEQWIKDGAAEK